MPPNIVLILSDDQRHDSIVDMPKAKALFNDGGVRFRKAFCGDPTVRSQPGEPARAAPAPHNHDVYSNADAYEEFCQRLGRATGRAR